MHKDEIYFFSEEEMIDLCSKLEEQFYYLARDLSALLDITVTKDHLILAQCTVLRRWPHLHGVRATKKIAKLIRDAVKSKVDIKALFLEDYERDEQLKRRCRLPGSM